MNQGSIKLSDLSPAMLRHLRKCRSMPLQDDMEFKSVSPCELKVNRKRRTVEGIWNMYNIVDLGGDRVLSGAFADSIAKDGPDGTKRIKMFEGHEKSIGVATMLKETDEMLFGAGRVTDHPSLDVVLEKVRDRTYGDWSIGWWPKKKNIIEDEESGTIVREIVTGGLLEGSLVHWPMNEMSRITGMKSAADVIATGGPLSTALMELHAGVLILDDPDLSLIEAKRSASMIMEIGIRAEEALKALGFKQEGKLEPVPDGKPADNEGGNPDIIEKALEAALASVIETRDHAIAIKNHY